MEVLTKRFHLIGNTTGFPSQNQESKVRMTLLS